MIPAIRYLYCSKWVSYEIDCVILEKYQNDTYKIRYYDRVLKEEEVDVVPEDRLIFPKHSELLL